VGVLAAVLVAVLGFAGLIAKWVADDSVPVAGAWRLSPPVNSAPIAQSPNETRGASPAFAIGRTIGSLVVICGERTGPYEYLGVRLSDAAMLRTAASTNSTHGFLARKAGVLYAGPPAN